MSEIDVTKRRRIVRIYSENVKRVRVVDIPVQPSGLTRVVGNNGEGKSSAINAFEYGICGTRSHPPEVIRRGATKAKTLIETDDGLKVRRRWNRKGTDLVLTDESGDEAKAPQRLLDQMFDQRSFRVGAFMELTPAELAAELRSYAGIDFTDLDASREALKKKRSDLKAQIAARERMLGDAPSNPGPVESADDLLNEQQRRREEIAANEEARGALKILDDAIENGLALLAAQREEIAGLEARIAELTETMAVGQINIATLRSERDKQAFGVSVLVDPDLSEIDEKLRNIQARTAALSAYQAWHKSRAEIQALEKQHDEADAQVRELDESRHAMLASAQFPVEGLTIGDEGPLLHGFPLEQASQAERIIAFSQLALSSRPSVRSVVLDEGGNDLDDKSLDILDEWAVRDDVQIIIEMVRNTQGKPCVVIEDGVVAGTGLGAEDGEQEDVNGDDV